MVKVSVILPTFNSAGSLQNTLNSILGQTGSGTDFQLELIVIDDCSTDDTRRILAENGIAFLSTQHNSGGPNKGRNIGLDHATGDVICFIDHDDIWTPDKIQQQLKLARFYPIVTTGYSVVDSMRQQHVGISESVKGLYISPRNEMFLEKLTRRKHIHQPYPSTIMIHHDLRDVRFEEEFGMVDYDWQLRLFEGHEVARISTPLVTRNVSGGNLSLNQVYRKHDYQYSLKCLSSYAMRYPDEVAIARKRINGTLARYFYVIGEMAAARQYFKQSIWNLKTFLYYCTTYFGDDIVKKYFRVFG